MSPVAFSAAEDKVWQAFPRGELVDLSTASDRDVGAGVILELLLGAQPAVPGKASALRLTGAHITGSLELTYADVTSMIWLSDCEFDQAVKLEGTTRRVVFDNCQLPGLTARGVRVDGQLSLYGTQVDGTVALLGATINGELDLSTAKLRGRNDMAISAARLVVRGNLLAKGMKAVGKIELSGAQIAGNLDFSGAEVSNPVDKSVAAERIAIGEQLNFTGFRSEGEVMLRGGRIDGQVLFSKASLVNLGGYALHASALTVGDSLYLWDGFTADGEIVLRRARINGGVHAVTIGSIIIDADAVTADSFLLRVGDPVGSAISLRQANVRQLRGKPDDWPSRVSLDGLNYEKLEELDPQRCAAEWLEWLRSDGGRYVPQPYEQLSAAYRRLGDDAGARQVQLAKQRMRRGTLKPAAKFWGYLQDWTVGYGYQPVRAVAWLLALLIVGTVVFSVSPPSPLKSGEAPHFNAFIYTLDLLLPIVSFGQRTAWNPAGAEQWLAFLFIAAGWVLATSVAAGITRALSRT
ncbi:MAG: hypothetical protein ACLPQY_14715 [Streptosporangiaceae bacterium]